MEQTEEIYKKIKENDSKEIRDVLKDIVLIDGAIVEEKDLEYKKKTYSNLESKYYTKLYKLKYYSFQERVDDKLDKYIESSIKEANTNLGVLKLFLIRIAALELVRNDELKEVLDKIYKEENHKRVKDYYEQLDRILLRSI